MSGGQVRQKFQNADSNFMIRVLITEI